MRVLITGGAGFIGSHIADALLAASCEVLVLDNLSTGRRKNVPHGARFVEGDIRDAALVSQLFADFAPQAVTHQAAQASVAVSTREPLLDAEVNVMGSLRLIAESLRHGVSRFVFASTGGAIYGEVPEGERARVEQTPNPRSPYACSKFAVETYLRGFAEEAGLRSTILRYANVYGPRQDPHGEAGVVAIFSERILTGQPIRINARRTLGDDGCVRDYVYVADVVKANLLALLGELPHSPMNVCCGQPTTTRELAQHIAAAANKEVIIEPAPRRAGDLERSVLTPPQPGSLGTPMPLSQGLAPTLAWFSTRA
jgi:UDP-glucose 4-epimerase